MPVPRALGQDLAWRSAHEIQAKRDSSHVTLFQLTDAPVELVREVARAACGCGCLMFQANVTPCAQSAWKTGTSST